ncbi:mitochondrial ribosomal protein L37-domain-containing protein [Coniochaeta sp. 2T2.1]|nr:mitochondrial ribosomal protein L37-domain-containing protein [Coniochaeta sp. 2T2.1]
MICRTCFRRVASLATRQPLSLPFRSFSTSIPFRNAAAAAAASQHPELTTPIQPAAAAEDQPSRSICKAGTPLNGLNFIKGKTDPVALADEEYPEWLWNCLDVQKKASDAAEDDAGDEFSKSKKQRRLAAKRQRALEEKIMKTGDLSALAPKIPLSQQSINLPAKESGDVKDALEASAKREELRKAMRKERKAKIKETNYLKSM